MIERIQRIGLFVKSALFTTIFHGILLVMLLVGQWQFSQESIKRGTTKPIQAQVISTDYIQQKKAAKLAQEKKKREQEVEKKRLVAEKKKKREQEKKRLAAEKKRKQEAEKKRLEVEKKKKREQEKKQLAAEKKRKQEAQKKRLEVEKKKKREQEEKRLAVEKKRKQEAQKKQLEAERLKREQELKEELKKERLRQQAQTKLDAATALSALVDRIAIVLENNWRRPLNSATGLEVTINVKVSRNGDVLSANVVKSSGDRFFDESAVRAVKKASPLPFPLNPKYYEFIDDFNIKFNPDDE